MQNYSSYKLPFDISNRNLEERLITKRIIENLNNGTWDSYDSYESFKKYNNLNNVTKHFGSNLNDSDFKEILNKIQLSNGYDGNDMNGTKNNSKQLGLKTSAGALFKEE